MKTPNFPSNKAQAIYGVTLLGRGAPRLGFTLRDHPKNLLTWFDRIFMIALLVPYNNKGGERLLQGTTYGSYPQEVWISCEEFIRNYGGES